MKTLSSLLVFGLVWVLPSSAAADDVTITDWRGASVTATEGWVYSGDVRIVYHTVGEGPLVLFVHSISGPWFDFRHQMVMLSEKYRVVSMSTRGTDKSDKPVGHEHYASARISDDIAAIIDHLGEDKATIVGQDSGGMHAWHFAMTHPEKTERLISLGSAHPAGVIRELVDNPDQQKASTFQHGMQENPNAATEYGARLRNRPANPDEPAELARLRKEAYVRTDPESVVGFYKSNWPTRPVTMETESFGFRYGEFPPVKAPTLFIYGRGKWSVHELHVERHVGVGGCPLDHSCAPGGRAWTAHPGARDRDAAHDGVARNGSIVDLLSAGLFSSRRRAAGR